MIRSHLQINRVGSLQAGVWGDKDRDHQGLTLSTWWLLSHVKGSCCAPNFWPWPLFPDSFWFSTWKWKRSTHSSVYPSERPRWWGCPSDQDTVQPWRHYACETPRILTCRGAGTSLLVTTEAHAPVSVSDPLRYAVANVIFLLQKYSLKMVNFTENHYHILAVTFLR